MHLWGNPITNPGLDTLLEIIQDHNHTLTTISLPEDELSLETLMVIGSNDGFEVIIIVGFEGIPETKPKFQERKRTK